MEQDTRRILFIINPTAGNGHPDRVNEVIRRLRLQNLEVDEYTTSSEGSATDYMRRLNRHYDTVVVAGGDGTINEVVNGLDHLQKLNPELALAVVPVGTANVLAAELGLTHEVNDIVKRLLGNNSRDVYFARINEQRFVMMAGFGFDAWVVQAVSSRLKHYVGKLAYIISMLRQIKHYGKHCFTIECGGRSYSAYSLVVANGAHYGGNFIISRQSDISAPRFQVLLYQSKSRWRLLQYLFALPLGKMELIATLTAFPATRFQIHSDADDVIQLDGDIRGMIKAGQTMQVYVDDHPTKVIV